MSEFAATANLPGFTVQSEWKTEKVLVQQTQGGSGATLESFHILHFCKETGASPGSVQMNRA